MELIKHQYGNDSKFKDSGGILISSSCSSDGEYVKITDYNCEDEVETELLLTPDEALEVAEKIIEFVGKDFNFERNRNS